MIYLLEKDTNRFISKAQTYKETDHHYFMEKSAKNNSGYMKDRTYILELEENLNVSNTDIWTGIKFTSIESINYKSLRAKEILQELNDLDKKLTRGAEDLIDLLITAKTIESEDNLPVNLKSIRKQKRQLRQELSILNEEGGNING